MNVFIGCCIALALIFSLDGLAWLVRRFNKKHQDEVCK